MTDTTVTVELPAPVLADLERLARDRGLTPAELLAHLAVAQVRGVEEATAFFRERAKRGDRAALEQFLNREGGEPPRPGDEID